MHAQLVVALAGLTVAPADGATVELAKAYALAIDKGEANVVKVGPLLLACLDALLMTPRARAALLPKGGTPDVDTPKRSPADELRARRAARVAGSAAVDPAAP